MLVLGVETSCDDTAAAVLLDGRAVLASIVSSQDGVHGPYSGVVPELASRQHVRHILPIIDGTLKKAGVELKDLDGIAVTRGPGLVGSLLVGLSVAKGISFRWGIPYVGINHLEAHLLAIFLEREVSFPYVALLASGGHTLLYSVRGYGDYLYLGGTRDDAAGEAYDKVAKMMGLGYPGGRVIDQLARGGDRQAIRFPRARMKQRSFDFSFSGLKTAVWHHLKARGEDVWQARKSDIAASFQEAVVDMLVRPTLAAAAELGVGRIVLAGGVAANNQLRRRAGILVRSLDGQFLATPKKFTGDNAAMIGLAAQWAAGRGEIKITAEEISQVDRIPNLNFSPLIK